MTEPTRAPDIGPNVWYQDQAPEGEDPHIAAIFGWKGPGWYHRDETDAYIHGPFPTEQEAEDALSDYIAHL